MLARTVQTQLDVYCSDGTDAAHEQMEMGTLLLDSRGKIVPLPIQVFETLCVRGSVSDRYSIIHSVQQGWLLLAPWETK